MYHPLLRWVIPLVLLVAIAIVWFDHRRKATAGRQNPHHSVDHSRNHVTAAGVLAIVLIISFIGSFLIP